MADRFDEDCLQSREGTELVATYHVNMLLVFDLVVYSKQGQVLAVKRILMYFCHNNRIAQHQSNGLLYKNIF